MEKNIPKYTKFGVNTESDNGEWIPVNDLIPLNAFKTSFKQSI